MSITEVKAGIPMLSLKKVYILWRNFLGLIAFRFDQAIIFFMVLMLFILSHYIATYAANKLISGRSDFPILKKLSTLKTSNLYFSTKTRLLPTYSHKISRFKMKFYFFI